MRASMAINAGDARWPVCGQWTMATTTSTGKMPNRPTGRIHFKWDMSVLVHAAMGSTSPFSSTSSGQGCSEFTGAGQDSVQAGKYIPVRPGLRQYPALIGGVGRRVAVGNRTASLENRGNFTGWRDASGRNKSHRGPPG